MLALGSVQEELGLNIDAQASYQEVIEMHPGNIKGYIALAKFQLNHEEAEQALRTIKEGIIQVPADYRGYQTLGDIHIFIDQENLTQAEQAYQTGLTVVPGSPALYASIGDLHTKRTLVAWNTLKSAKELERLAKNHYAALLARRAPDEHSGRQSRFVVQMLAEAKQIYDRNYREMLLAQEEYDQTSITFDVATSNFTDALALEPNNELALLGLGRLQIARGMESEAISYLEQASALNPHSNIALSQLAGLYQETGRSVDAFFIIQRIRALDPGNPSAQAALSEAINNLPNLTISQAAESVKLGTKKLESLVMFLRERDSELIH
jgi:tetratricopeptide (TPR) repeat protein